MTNTTTPKSDTSRRKKRTGKPHGRESAVAQRRHRRTPTDVGLALITWIVGQEFLDLYHLRDPLNRALRYGIKQAFSVSGASTRQFKRVQGLRSGPTRLKTGGKGYFDLIPDEDQKLII